MEEATRPFIVMTVLVNSAARPAAVTRSHADALERVRGAAYGHDIGGIEITEVTLPAKTFNVLRKAVGLPATTVGLYDIFPVSPEVTEEHRRVAGKFLAAEAIWALDEQRAFGAEALHFRLELPQSWSREPKEIHKTLIDAGVLNLSAAAVETFRQVKAAWEATQPALVTQVGSRPSTREQEALGTHTTPGHDSDDATGGAALEASTPPHMTTPEASV